MPPGRAGGPDAASSVGPISADIGLAHVLLDAGARPDERNFRAAEQNGDPAMAALLREYER